MGDDFSIKGRAFASGTSRPQEAILLVSGDVLDLMIGEDVISRAAFSKVSIDPPLGHTTRRLTLPDGTLFETDDHKAIAVLTGQTRGNFLHKMEDFGPNLVVFVGAAIVAVWFLWRFGLDIIASAAVAVTPQVFVDQLDQGTLKTIDFGMAAPSTLPDDAQERAREIFTKMVVHVPDDAKDGTGFNLVFRSMPRVGPNAFAMPGGTIVVTDQFVEKFSDDDVLAAVLGHELGHVIEQHGLKQLYRSLSLYVLIAFLAGDTGPILEDVVLQGNLLLSLNYSRKHERSADIFGLQLTHDAGFDPSGFREFFEYAIKEDSEVPDWLSSHPSSKERLKAIDEFIDELN